MYTGAAMKRLPAQRGPWIGIFVQKRQGRSWQSVSRAFATEAGAQDFIRLYQQTHPDAELRAQHVIASKGDAA